MHNHKSGIFKYVAEVDPPSLIQMWDQFCAAHNITPGQIISALGHRDRTVRERLRGERPMDVEFFFHWCMFTDVDQQEAMARYVGSLQPEEIGAIQRARGTPPPTSCSATGGLQEHPDHPD